MLHGQGAKAPAVFVGEGNKLGSSSSSTPAPAAEAKPAPAQPLREVDPDRPLVTLRVQLLDRKPAKVVVNEDFTIQELRAWLDHHMGSQQNYNLMEVSGFPPKKLADLGSTVAAAGLTASSSLACRPL